MDALVFEEVSFGYEGLEVLSNINFRLEEGSFTAVVGPNGGGKTTIINLALGLLTPSSGRISVFGQPPGSLPGLVCHVPQRFAGMQDFPLLVRDVVMLGLKSGMKLTGPFRRSEKHQADELLSRLGLLHLARRPFGALSGGERQRVLIARALAGQPRLLLLDEPTANVDLPSQQSIHGILREWDGRTTILMVTHDMNFVYGGAARVLCVNRSAAIHPTGEAAEEEICRIYGTHMKRVLHDRYLGGFKENGGPGGV
jgi:zinc transport system ATP-binding protein